MTASNHATDAASAPDDPAGAAGAAAAPLVVVADDSRTQRLMLSLLLRRRGYRVLEACDGAEALALLRAEPAELLITDWMMPRMSGPELCRALRAERGPADPYVHTVLLTARAETLDLSEGLGAGADDFLTKPVAEDELIARLETGRRAAALHGRLLAQTRALDDALGELRRAQALLERDLELAGILQRETVPPPFALCNGAPVATFWQSSGHVGGDLLGHFPAEGRKLGVFSADVAGHGVASALRAAHLSQMLLRPMGENVAFLRTEDGGLALRDPAETVTDLNRRFAASREHELFFTMALVTVDLATGEGRCCRAGHGAPILLRADGRCETLERGWPPVGLLQGIPYDSERFRLGPGDRLLLFSDGLSEGDGADGRQIDAERLEAHFAELADLPLTEVLPELVRRIAADRADAEFDDDVSALLLECPAVYGAQA